MIMNTCGVAAIVNVEWKGVKKKGGESIVGSKGFVRQVQCELSWMSRGTRKQMLSDKLLRVTHLYIDRTNLAQSWRWVMSEWVRKPWAAHVWVLISNKLPRVQRVDTGWKCFAVGVAVAIVTCIAICRVCWGCYWLQSWSPLPVMVRPNWFWVAVKQFIADSKGV